MRPGLQQPTLSDRIRSLVREQIVGGELGPGTRINEVHLARELQVSRTPLREALTGLVAEGALSAVARRGFFVRPLSVDEFLHIYPIRAILDPAAFRLAGIPGPERIQKLERINERLRREGDVEARVRLDDAWHLELLAPCPNPVLLELIQQFMQRTRRYELALYRETRNLEISTSDHERVMEAARRGDMDAALVALDNNLRSGIEPVVAWLRERKPAAQTGARRSDS